MAYTIFYWVHTVSYICWLLAFVGSLIYRSKIVNAQGSLVEKSLIQTERKITSIGAHIGALGILISGGAMASMPGGPQWGWFNFSAHGWLAVKQSIFVIILILVVFSVKKSIGLKKQLRSEEGNVSDEARKLWKGAYSYSLTVYLLVVVNVILGLFRPF